MTTAGDVVKLLAAGLGGAGSGQLARWVVRRPVTRAKAEQIAVDTARGLMGELRTELAGVRTRVVKLEERERHMLARVAAHEGWDRVAYLALVSRDPNHPPPPPITGPDLDPDNRDAYGEETP